MVGKVFCMAEKLIKDPNEVENQEVLPEDAVKEEAKPQDPAPNGKKRKRKGSKSSNKSENKSTSTSIKVTKRQTSYEVGLTPTLKHYTARNRELQLYNGYYNQVAGRLNSPEYQSSGGRQLVQEIAQYASNYTAIATRPMMLPDNALLSRSSPLDADQRYYNDFQWNDANVASESKLHNKRMRYPALISYASGILLDSRPLDQTISAFSTPANNPGSNHYDSVQQALDSEVIAFTTTDNFVEYQLNARERTVANGDVTDVWANRAVPPAEAFDPVGRVATPWIAANQHNTSPLRDSINDVNWSNSAYIIAHNAQKFVMEHVNDRTGDKTLDRVLSGWLNNVPYVQSLIGDLSAVGTLLYILADVINLANSRTQVVYEKTGILPFAYKSLQFRSTHSHLQVGNAFKALQYYSDKFPVNSEVIAKWNEVKHLTKLTDGDLSEEDNAILAPYFSLIFRGHATHPTDHATAHLRSVNTRESLGQTTVQMPVGSLFDRIVGALDTMPTFDGARTRRISTTGVSISSAEVTDFMHAFIWQFSPTMRTINAHHYLPDILDSYLLRFAVVLAMIKDTGVMSGTIFTYLPQVAVVSDASDMNLVKHSLTPVFETGFVNTLILPVAEEDDFNNSVSYVNTPGNEFMVPFQWPWGVTSISRHRIVKFFTTGVAVETPTSADSIEAAPEAKVEGHYPQWTNSGDAINTLSPVYYDSTVRYAYETRGEGVGYFGTFCLEPRAPRFLASQGFNTYTEWLPMSYMYVNPYLSHAGINNSDQFVPGRTSTIRRWNLYDTTEVYVTTFLIQALLEDAEMHHPFEAYLKNFGSTLNQNFYNPKTGDVRNVPIAIGWAVLNGQDQDVWGVTKHPNDALTYRRQSLYSLPDVSVYKAFVGNTLSTLTKPNKHILTFDDLDSDYKFVD